MKDKRKENKTLIAVDGNALLHRAWHALPPLTDRQGRVVNAVYGFLTILFKTVRDYQPTHLVVTFDRPGKTWRHDAYGEYKATRVKQPDELYAQIPILEDVLRAFGVPVFGVEGFEADDVLGTISHRAEKEGDVLTLILTGDMDTLQLIGPRTKIVTLRKGLSDDVVYDAAAVRARYGLEPAQMIDYKALRGDPSDNIKGVAGVGEKTASELLKKHGSVERLYSDLKDGKATEIKGVLRKKLIDGEADATLAKDLVTIGRDLDIDFSLRRAEVVAVPRERVVELLADLGFKSLLDRIPDAMVESDGERAEKVPRAKSGKGKSGTEPETWIITDAAEATSWAKRAGTQIFFICGDEPSLAVLDGGQVTYLHGNFAVRAAKPVLENPKIDKTTHDLKAADKILSGQGIKLSGVGFDTMIADYLVAPGTRGHDLATLALEHLKEELPSEAGGQGTLLARSPDDLARDATRKLGVVSRVAPILAKLLDERHQTHLMTEIELPLARILADMERVGVKIDSRMLGRMSEDFARRIAELSKAIWKEAGEEFNISSPQQLKEILFEKLRIPTERIKMTATGSGLSTAASELEKLRGLHPIVDLIFEYRELTKLKSTYVDALPALVDATTGRLHTSYNQTVTSTGRVSSSDPNLQNIPVRTELGRDIRRAFVADKGDVLVSADYSQIELRLIASIAGAKGMIEAFKNGEDIHSRTAALVWDIELEKVTPEQRRAAKAVNFGVIYGMGPHGLAQGAGIPLTEAKEFIRKYFEANQEIRDYIDLTKELARKQGYVETVFGRRRYLPEIGSGIPQLVAAAERMAVNHPLQGTAADVLKIAMIKVHASLRERFPAARLILTVHDELVVETSAKDAVAVGELLKNEMEGAHRFVVPLTVEVEIGENWGEMRKV